MDASDAGKTLHHDVYPEIDPRGALQGSCAGKTVLITGAGRGIGKTIAASFAAAGASTVIIAARSSSELDHASTDVLAAASGNPPRVIASVTDVTSESSVEALFQRLGGEGLTVDILVNNAGIMEVNKLMHESDPSNWWSVWEVNVKGAYLPTHFLLKSRRSSDIPVTIICTSSLAANRTRPTSSAYACSKTAVNRFVEFIHAEYAESGVRAFALHPGGVLTKLAFDFIPPAAYHLLTDKPELAGGFCVWLASARAADAFRGKYISCNWDVSEMCERAVERAEDEQWLTTRLVL